MATEEIDRQAVFGLARPGRSWAVVALIVALAYLAIACAIQYRQSRRDPIERVVESAMLEMGFTAPRAQAWPSTTCEPGKTGYAFTAKRDGKPVRGTLCVGPPATTQTNGLRGRIA